MTEITTDPTDIKIMIKEYYEQLYVNELGLIYEIVNFLEKYTLS